MNEQNINLSNNNKQINKINNKTDNNLQKTFQKDILRVLISIYYYEETELKNKKENIFNKKENYYLIKSNWIINFKKYYDYQTLSKLLNNFKLNDDKQDILINSNNFEKYISDIKTYLDKKKFNSVNKEIFKDLINNNEIAAFPYKLKNTSLIYLKDCYIINSKIMNIIKKYLFGDKEFNIKEKKIFYNFNYIFLSNINNKSMNIIVGYLNDELIFCNKYFLSYNSFELFLNEKEFILQNNFIDYIKSRKCQENNFNIQKIIIVKNNKIENIGELLKFTPIKKIFKKKTINQNKSHLAKKLENKSNDILEIDKKNNKNSFSSLFNSIPIKQKEIKKSKSTIKNSSTSKLNVSIIKTQNNSQNKNNELNNLKNAQIKKFNTIQQIKILDSNKNNNIVVKNFNKNVNQENINNNQNFNQNLLQQKGIEIKNSIIFIKKEFENKEKQLENINASYQDKILELKEIKKIYERKIER